MAANIGLQHWPSTLAFNIGLQQGPASKWFLASTHDEILLACSLAEHAGIRAFEHQISG